MKIPQHVAIILDGNGRWRKRKICLAITDMPRGARTWRGSVRLLQDGDQILTVYAFSTENWSRPSDEVNALMKLLRNYMKTCLKTAEKNRMRVRVIGDKTGLDDDIRTRIEELEELLPEMMG